MEDHRHPGVVLTGGLIFTTTGPTTPIITPTIHRGAVMVAAGGDPHPTLQ